MTGAGTLPHKAIIHVVGINLLWRASEHSIRRSVQSAVAATRERGFTSLAFPLLGAGTGGKRRAAVLGFMQDELQRVAFAGEVRIMRYRRRGP